MTGVYVFIILHYNSFDATKMCIDSILKLEQQENIKIIVIDNASINDSYSELKIQYKETNIDFLQNKENKGFSVANNIAYEFCKSKYDCDFVVFANNDLEFVQKDLLNRIKSEYDKSNFAVLGPDIYNPIIDTHQSPISYKMERTKFQVRKTIVFNWIALKFFDIYYRLFKTGSAEKYEKKDEGTYQENIIPLGACLIFSRHFLDKKKKVFSPETFFYYEEYILANWCKKNGEKIVYQPDIKVKHYHGMATKSIGDSKKSELFRMKNMYEASKLYYKEL